MLKFLFGEPIFTTQRSLTPHSHALQNFGEKLQHSHYYWVANVLLMYLNSIVGFYVFNTFEALTG